MRAIATRTVSFGLVSIPVKIYSTKDSSETISFRMLHDKCHSRLRQQYVCTKDGEIVSRAETVKGYEFAKDQYVVFTEEELKAVEAEASEEIEITEFVPLQSVDPVYFDSVYYLGPDKGGDRAYRLLGEALEQTGLTAVARYASRGKQYLVLLRPNDQGGLTMQQLRYPDEIRAFSEVPLKDGTEVKEAELQLALQLIAASASEAFHPERYTDEVKTRLQAAIEQKVEGEEISLAPAAEPKARVIDLMEALKASLQATTGSGEEAAGGERKPARRATRKSAEKKKGASTS